MPRKLTKTEWIVKSQAKHGEGKYDYSQAIYINSESKVKIVCLTCGKAFEQSAIVHSRGQGCRNCHNKRLSQYMTYTLDDFITKSYSAHAVGKYDYSQVIYTS